MVRKVHLSELHLIMWLKSRRVRRRLIGIWGADVAVLYLLVEKDN